MSLIVLALAGPVHAGWDAQESGTPEDLLSITAAHSTNDVAWACGSNGVIVHTTDGGATWVTQDSGTDLTLHGIAFIETEGGPVVAVGDAGTILVTFDDGATWTPVASGTTETLRAVSDFGYLIVGDGGTILRSPDTGVDTWFPVESGTTENLHAVTGAFTRFACGENGTILLSGNGENWFPRDPGTGATLLGLPMSASSTLVVGEGGLILEGTASWEVWTPRPSGTTHDLRAIEFSRPAPARAYVVGDGGTILKTTDAGQSWAAQSSGTTADLHDVFFYLTDLVGFACGEGGTILRTTDGGAGAVDVGESAAVTPSLGLGVRPNPASRGRALSLSLDLPRGGEVRVELFDVTGARREVLLVGVRGAGTHGFRVRLDAVSAGVYFLRVDAGGLSATRRVTVIR